MPAISRFAGVAILFSLLFLISAASAGSVRIIVQPGSGTVCLDTDCRTNQGSISGTSDTVFENIATGSYHMINVYGIKGYEPYLKQFFFDPASPSVTREIRLEPVRPSSPETGLVQVFITPDGGEACIDATCEKSTGDSSGSWSVQFTVTPNTYHTLTLSHAGYQTYTKQVRVLSGQTTTLNIVLKPLPSAPSAPAPSNRSSLPPPAQQATKSGIPEVLSLLALGISMVVVARRNHR